jgi:hypothetical protein
VLPVKSVFSLAGPLAIQEQVRKNSLPVQSLKGEVRAVAHTRVTRKASVRSSRTIWSTGVAAQRARLDSLHLSLFLLTMQACLPPTSPAWAPLLHRHVSACLCMSLLRLCFEFASRSVQGSAACDRLIENDVALISHAKIAGGA